MILPSVYIQSRLLAGLLVCCAAFSNHALAFSVGWVTEEQEVPTFTGEVHQDITREALQSISVVHPIRGILRFSDPAIELVVLANQVRDRFQDNGIFHFDDNALESASSLINREKEIILGVLKKRTRDAFDGAYAQQELGYALHAIQDFYAHSNWSQFHEVFNPELGRKIVMHTDDPTCSEANTSEIITRKPFTGYAGGKIGLLFALASDGKCAHGLFGNGIHKDWTDRVGYELARRHAVDATIDFVQNQIIGALTGDLQGVCVLLGAGECSAPPLEPLRVDSRGTWISETNIPANFPLPLGPATFDLPSAGIKGGDALELGSLGNWQFSGYFGVPTTAVGATGVFASGVGTLLSSSPVSASDPGTAAPASPIVTPKCPDNDSVDISQDFYIPDNDFVRVKVPSGAVKLLLSVPDCYHGDNVGVVEVKLQRPLAPISVDSRGTWLLESRVPKDVPSPIAPVSFDLWSHGLGWGDVIEVRATGSFKPAGSWGNTAVAVGASGVFRGPSTLIAPDPLSASDPGSSSAVWNDITGTCPGIATVDVPEDFSIRNNEWRRVKIPYGAAQLLLSVSDCFHGDNIGSVDVEIRKLQL